MSLDTTHASSAAPGLQLDARQQAMLEAMGIQFWQPAVFEEKRPPAQQNIAQAAPKLRATEGAVVTPDHQAPLPAQAAPRALSSAPPAPRASLAPPPARGLSPAAATALQPLPDGIAQMDWSQLQAAVASCQACALCAGRKNSVFGMGQTSSEPALAPRADWLIVGEAPTEEEDAQGQPFVGPAGQLLDNMLRAMRVNGQPLERQHNVFITGVLKCRPPGDRLPSADEVALCQPYLARQIALLQPKIILAMGRVAVQALTGSSEPLGKLRGRVHPLAGAASPVPVIVTYHPANLLRNQSDKAKAWADLLLAMDTLDQRADTAMA